MLLVTFPTSFPSSDLTSGVLFAMGLVDSMRFLEKSKALSRLVSSATSALLKNWYQIMNMTRKATSMRPKVQPTTTAMMREVWLLATVGQVPSNAPGSSKVLNVCAIDKIMS